MLSALDSLITTITAPIRQLFYLLQRINPGSDAYRQLSLPMRWAILSFLCLAIALGAALVRFVLEPDRAPGNWVAFVGIPLVCLVVIPVIVYWFVVYWLKEEPSKYPDIDRVMNDAIERMAAQQLSFTDLPIFLVLGTDSVPENRNLLESASLKISVHAPGQGDGPLSIHTSKEAIWIFPHGCSATSRLRGSSANVSPHEPMAKETSIDDEPQGTMAAEDLNVDFEDQERDWGRAVDKEEEEEPVVEGGTVQVNDFDPARYEAKAVSTPPKQLLGQDLADTEDRLKYLCSLIKKARNHLCPINGLLTAIPFDLIENRPDPMILAIKKDLQVLRCELQLRVANTLMVTGMEHEPGFIEMTRRLGPQRITKQRIGKGSEIWVTPESERLSAISKQATSLVEEQIFDLFQRDDALRNKQNPKLFTLLARMRGSFAQNLSKVMEEGFGFDPAKQPELANEQFLFSGCYFAACGSERSRQAFVPSVLGKVVELQSDIEWLPAATRQNARYRTYANWMAFLALLAILATAAMLLYQFWPVVMPSRNPS